MYRKHISRIGFIALTMMVLAPTFWVVTAQTHAETNKLVILVRHAEKEAVPVDNPVLSEAGWDRASALATMLERADINHIVTSQLDRTILTARYVAESRGLEPEKVQTSGGLLNHINGVVEAIHRRPDGEAILVVGHSNTIPRIVNTLVDGDFQDLEDSNYSTVYIVTLSVSHDPRVVVSTFGAGGVAE